MIDRLPKNLGRSAIVEEALVLYFKNRQNLALDNTDRDILDRLNKELNEEALDALESQAAIKKS